MSGWDANPYALALICIATFIGIAVVPTAWHRRRLPGGYAFFALSLATLVWGLGYGIELGAPTLKAKLILTDLEYLGIVSVPVSWFVFSLQYTQHGKWLTGRRFALLLLFPVVTLLLLWTNDLHGLMQRDITLDSTGPFAAISKSFGPWFWVFYTYSFLLLLAGTRFLVHQMIRSTSTHRGQAFALLVAVLPPWSVNALHLARIYPIHRLDLTVIAFGGSVIALAFGLHRYRLLDLIPLAQDVAAQEIGVGLMVADRDGSVVGLNPAAERLVGVSPSSVIGRRAVDLIPPLSTLQQEGSHAEWAIKRGTQEVIVEVQQWPLSDRWGESIGTAITLHDIGQRKAAERALEETNARIIRLHEASLRLAPLEEEVSVFDHTVRMCREELPLTACAVYVVREDSLCLAAMTPPEAVPAFPSSVLLDGTHPAAIAFRSKESVPFEPLTHTASFGGGSGLYIPIPDIGVLEIVAQRDEVLSMEDTHWVDLLLQHVSEDVKRIRLREKLQEQARRDTLTGVFNRRHLIDAIRTESARAKRHGYRLAFVMIDINGFKAVNDHHGHPIGDRVLQEIGRLLLHHVREYDVVIRYGGDEFLLILSEIDREVDTIVERFRGVFRSWKEQTEWLSVPLSLAMGIARWTPETPDTDWEKVLQAADRAMYEDKKNR